MEVTLTLSLEDIQMLNNILMNSTPTHPYTVGVTGKFVQKINTQIQDQLQKQKTEQLKAVDTDEVDKDSE